MAASSSPSISLQFRFFSLVIMIMIFVFLNTFHTTHAVNKVVLRNTCAHTKNPTFCIETLQADPRTKTCDLFGLVSISINLATVNATKTLGYIDSELLVATYQKQHFQYCHEKYQTAISYIKLASDAYITHDYSAVIETADKIEVGIQQCEANFSSPPAPIQSPMTINNSNLENLADMISAITKQLP